MNKKICIVYTHHKLGDLIWQLPYIKAISEHHNQSVDLILREKTQAKKILKDENYIDHIYYNNFRKGIFYWIEVLKLFKIFNQKKYSHVYILDKVNRPAIAAKIANIKNIIGPGIGNQKKYLTTKIVLKDEDWKLNYSEQSKKLLKLHNINLNKIKKFLKKLDLKVIHIHANNYGGVDKYNNPKVIELSLINTRKIKIKNIFSKRKYPIINLDYKNFKRRDDIKIEFNE